MKKVLSLLLCCLLCQLTVVALAQDQSLPVLTITYSSESPLSRDNSTEVQVVLMRNGQETTFRAELRFNDETLDLVERALPQKSLRIDSDSGSFVLYNGGNDVRHSMIVSAICCNMIAKSQLDIPVCAQEPVEVYLNGQYQGMYTGREYIVDAIVRIEGLKDTATLSVTNMNKDAICGNAAGIIDDIKRIKGLDLSRDTDRMILDELMDTESFLNVLVVKTYFGISNHFGEIYFYRIGEGPIKCMIGDMAYAFFDPSINTFSELDNNVFPQYDAGTLADMLIEQPEYRDVFLAKLGTLYQTLPIPLMQEIADAENDRISSVLPDHMNRWAYEYYQELGTAYTYPATDAQEALLFQEYQVYCLRNQSLVLRPWYVYDNTQRELNVSDDDMIRYFGDANSEFPQVHVVTWKEYKSANPI